MPQPPEDWYDRTIVYKSLVSDTGYAGYYVSFHEKKFLTFGEFLSTIGDEQEWKEGQGATWILTVQHLDTDLSHNGPVKLYFRKEKSPSGKTNILLLKAVTQDYEIPWVLLDQIVMKAGENFNRLKG
ncbi:MAG: hypothetical protein ACE5E9_05605 [Nitrospinaceae bacterium]